MTNTKFFSACQTLADLKTEYRRLALLHHPDIGGDTATMQAINAEFDRLFPLFKLHNNSTPNTAESHETAESVRSEFYTANGWKGSNYNPARSLKEIAAIVRAYVKDKYPTYKFSVRTSYTSMCQELRVDVKEAPTQVYKTIDQLTKTDCDNIISRANRHDDWHLTSWTAAEQKAEIERLWLEHNAQYKIISDDVRAVANDVDDFVKSYNYEDCDGMIDYFDVDFYYFGCLQNNGINVKFVPREDKRRRAIIGSTSAETQNKNNLVARVAFCPEHDGIEVYFNGKPSEDIRVALKSDGWRWHNTKKCWYNHNTEDHLQALRIITTPAALKA